MKEPIYYGLFLDKPLTGTLKNQIPDQHITLAFRPTQEQQDIFNKLLGEEVTVKAIGYANDNKNETIEVEIEGEIPNFNNEGPKHITVSISDGAKPFDSNKLEFTRLPEIFQREFTCTLGAFMDKEKILFHNLDYYKGCEEDFNEKGLELTLDDICAVDKVYDYSEFIFNFYLNETDYKGDRPYNINELAYIASKSYGDDMLFDIKESSFYARELKIDPLAHSDPTMGKIDFGMTYFHRYLKEHPELTGINEEGIEKLITQGKDHKDIIQLIEYSNKIKGDYSHIDFNKLVKEAENFEPIYRRSFFQYYDCKTKEGYFLSNWLKDLKDVIDKQYLLGETPYAFFGYDNLKETLNYAKRSLNSKIEKRIEKYGEDWQRNKPVYEECYSRDR